MRSSQRFAQLALLAIGVAIAAGFALPGRQEEFDVLIKGGWVIDGAGNPAYRADVAVNKGKIAAIGTNLGSAKEVIDARGQIVAPGFIDVHTHAENVLEHQRAENFVRMGVTSIVIGNCGGSELPLRSFFDKLEKQGVSVNVASLVGHNTVRRNAMGGNFNRPPTLNELEKMKLYVEEAMQDGAVGLSTGLIYLPGTYSKTDEIIELAKISSQYGGLYASHMRSESTRINEAIDELIAVAKGADCRAQLSHIKLAGENAWGQTARILAKLEQARKEGIELTQDQYAYTASSTTISTLIPDEALEGGADKFKERLAKPAEKAKMVEFMKGRLSARGRTDYAYAVVANYRTDKRLNGKNLVEAAQILKGRNDLDAQIETILEMNAKGGASMVFHGMNEDDVKGFMRHPNTMVASDSSVRPFGEDVPHPRGYGNNARVLGRYVRELGVITLEDAIRRMTSLPAQTFRLKDRGLVKEGMAADLVVFDPAKVTDKATYDQPHQYAVGFKAVLVNGVPVVRDDAHSGAKPGVPLRRK
jgi:N-acyl-D-amino-acid deacylase